MFHPVGVENSGCNSAIAKHTDHCSRLEGNKEIGKLSIVFQSNVEICDVLKSNASRASCKASSLDTCLVLVIRNARKKLFYDNNF